MNFFFFAAAVSCPILQNTPSDSQNLIRSANETVIEMRVQSMPWLMRIKREALKCSAPIILLSDWGHSLCMGSRAGDRLGRGEPVPHRLEITHLLEPGSRESFCVR